MTRIPWRVILKRRAKDLFHLPGCHCDDCTIFVEEILRSLRSLQDDKFSTPRENDGGLMLLTICRAHPFRNSPFHFLVRRGYLYAAANV
ncbi:MAG: hypothetical protein ABI718_17175 [Acidobacteriota bacterium]